MVKSYAEQIEENNKYLDEGAEDFNSGLKEQAKAKAGEGLDYVAAEARKAASDPVGYFNNAKKSITEFTHAHPAKALSIAAGIGFVYGALRSIVRG